MFIVHQRFVLLLLSCFFNYVHPPNPRIGAFGSRGPNPESNGDSNNREPAERLIPHIPVNRRSSSRSSRTPGGDVLGQEELGLQTFPHLQTPAFGRLMAAVNNDHSNSMNPIPMISHNSVNDRYNQLTIQNLPPNSVPTSFPYISNPTYTSVFQPNITPHQRRIMEQNQRIHMERQRAALQPVATSPFSNNFPTHPRSLIVPNNTMDNYSLREALPNVLNYSVERNITGAQHQETVQNNRAVHYPTFTEPYPANTTSPFPVTVASSADTTFVDPDEVRKSRDRERKRKQRELEAQKNTPKEKKEKKDKENQRKRNERENESNEQREQRREQERIRISQRRTDETSEEMVARQLRDNEAHRQARENETIEETQERRRRDLVSHNERFVNENSEQIQDRQERNNESHRRRRQNMTLSQRARMNEVNRNNYHRRQEERRNRMLLIAEQDYNLAPHHLGPLTSECVLCGALYFEGEGVETNGGTYNKCCNHGRFALTTFYDFPDELKDLFIKIHRNSVNFHNNIRQFNNALAFASMDAQIKSPPGRGPYVFRVHGTVCYNMGPAIPNNGSPSYGQFYFMDTAQAADERMGRRPNINCSPALMLYLSEKMARINPLAQSFKQMGDVYREEEARAIANNTPVPSMKMVIYQDKSKDKRRYNAPISNEVAGIFVGPDGEVPTPRKYTVFLRDGRFNKLDVTNRKLDSMIYPLFWPTGGDSWHPDLRKEPAPGRQRVRITQAEFYGYLLSIRRSFNPLHYGGKLFQQFVVDLWLRMEQNKLEWARNNQEQLRSELYQDLDNFVSNGEGGLAGTRVVLPSSFIGSPRNYTMEYQDTMDMVSKFGKPDYFITFTCNSKWPEIVDNLHPGQDASDRPDLVSRVFNLKWKAFLKDIVENRIFGQVISYAYTVEWQKRGLPHCHLLLTVAAQHKPDTPQKVDRVISAEIPNPVENPDLYNIVKKHMLHRRCGATDPHAPCMVDGKCSKKFPKEFSNETKMEGHGYPEYRRRDTGITADISLGSTTRTYDNRYVVPYNKWLLAKYNCHINVEICSMLHAVKYLYKYVYKGSDKATVELRRLVRDENGGNVDEIAQHLDARYVCPPEAMHRIFGNKIQDRSHSIEHLQVHLPEGQRVQFQPGQERQALNRAVAERTNLLAYFALNQHWHEKEQRGEDLGLVDPRTLLYTEIPNHFVFKKVNGVNIWDRRDQGGNKKIGRMHGVSLKDRERFCLRQLLLKRKGARSYEDIRTLNGAVFGSFESAALAMGLLNSGDCIVRSMDEACQRQMPFQIRRLFASLILFFVPHKERSMDLWQQYSADMSEDFTRQGRTALDAEALAWYNIDDMVSVQNMEFKHFVPPPLPERPAEIVEDDPIDHVAIGQEMRTKLNSEQEHVVAEILSGVKLAFISGAGGCGKTFLYQTVYHILKGEGKVVLCAAWTGIAANLLPDGRTICSLFKLNPNDDNRTSSVRPNSKEGKALREMDTLILDEISMLSMYNLEAMDKCLKDVCNNNEAFGGKRVLMGGDFRQVLPIPPKHSGLDPFQISLKSSNLFHRFTHYELITNVRASTETSEWKQFLLSVGNGTAEEDNEGKIELPRDIISAGDLIDEIYEGIFDEADHINSRAILTPKNRRVAEINNDILNSMDGTPHLYYSYDQQELDEDSDQLKVSVEFMNQQTPPGFPLHELKLKVGCVIMLIRNLNIRGGLCNGTRLQVTRLGRNLITAAFITGPRKGEEALIPRIDILSGKGLSIKMRRTQFPVRLGFCMTVNKAQGQSLESVGIDLEDEVFSHGMLYVALSRCTTKSGVKIYTKDQSRKAVNVVDRRILE